MQAETLLHSTYHIRTGLGDSTDYYSHNDQEPIYGTGQGSCASPAIWLIISSFIMDILQQKANGMEITSIHKEIDLFVEWINGFVDDTSIFTNCLSETNSIKEIKKRLKNDGNLWSVLLQATGGKLEITKCFFYLLSWRWDTDCNPIPQSINEQNKIDNTPVTLSNEEGSELALKQIDVFESHKTLGSYKCIIGKESEQLKILTKKSNDLVSNVINGQLNRRLAKRAFISTYTPSMLYSLLSTDFNEIEINKIQQNAATAFIHLQGLDKSFPRAVIYGPKKFGGVELQQLSVNNNCLKIESILCNVNGQSQLGRLIMTNLELYQIHAGISCPVLNYAKPLDYVDNNWFNPIQEFLVKIKAKITFYQVWTPKLNRKNDKVLMEYIYYTNLTNKERKTFNNWRLYLKINNLSEISNIQGDYICQEFINEKLLHEYKPRSHLQWPNQAIPSDKTFTVWKKGLKQIINHVANGKLYKPLGTWYRSPIRSIFYTSLLSKSNDRLLILNRDNIWHLHRVDNTKHGKIYFTKTGIRQDDYELKAYDPIDIEYTDSHIVVKVKTIDYKEYQSSNNEVDNKISFKQFLLAEQSELSNTLKNVKIYNEQLLLESEELIVASDGSVQENKKGAFGLCFCKNGITLLDCKSSIPYTHIP